MRIRPILLLILLSGLLLVTLEANAWHTEDGLKIPGTPIDFDYEAKLLTFEEKIIEETDYVLARDLSLRDRQRLLVSPLFLESFPDQEWPKERIRLVLILVVTPALLLIGGFWISGLFLAKKVNPLRAIFGFVGSWVVGTLFVIFYLFFAARLGGGIKTVLLGTGLGLIALSFYISAVYQCSVFRGLIIFLAQIFFGFFLLVVGLAVTEVVVEKERLERFWNEKVFAPVGMIQREDR
ncbi:MAG: hypothetical protein AAGC68_09095 [Verrucomicrobiota bacterium]